MSARRIWGIILTSIGILILPFAINCLIDGIRNPNGNVSDAFAYLFAVIGFAHAIPLLIIGLILLLLRSKPKSE